MNDATRVEDLPDLWESQQARYPNDEYSIHAAAAIRRCVKELRKALAVQDIAPPVAEIRFMRLPPSKIWERHIKWLTTESIPNGSKLYLEAPASAPEKWQPIETAPKDGSWIMTYWPTMAITFYPFTVFWDEGWEPVFNREYGEVYPTHWMPLPEPPNE